jgi:hypothetical protein
MCGIAHRNVLFRYGAQDRRFWAVLALWVRELGQNDGRQCLMKCPIFAF